MTQITSGRKTVTTAGVAEKLPSLEAESVSVQALLGNAGKVVIGGSDVVAALATRKGIYLGPGDKLTIPTDDVSDLWVDAVTSGDGVSYKAAVPVLPAFDPITIAGLQAWLKADAITGKNDGDTITTWSDSSRFGHSPTQATGSLKPLYKTNIKNGLPVVRFDGTDDILQAADFTLNQPETVFVVGAWRGVRVGNDTILDGGTVGNTMRIYRSVANSVSLYNGVTTTCSPTDVTAFHLYTADANNTASTIGFDSGTPVTGSASAVNGGGLTVGAYGAGSEWGPVDVGEILVYDSTLSASDRLSVEKYLRGKWATP